MIGSVFPTGMAYSTLSEIEVFIDLFSPTNTKYSANLLSLTLSSVSVSTATSVITGASWGVASSSQISLNYFNTASTISKAAGTFTSLYQSGLKITAGLLGLNTYSTLGPISASN